MVWMTLYGLIKKTFKQSYFGKVAFFFYWTVGGMRCILTLEINETEVTVMQDRMDDNRIETEALEAFLADIECLEALSPWMDSVNMFDILNVSRKESSHCHMLSWLLDVKENHGLGDAFFKRWLQKLIQYAGKERYDSDKLLSMDFSSFRVHKEWKTVDLVLVSQKEKMVFALAMKVDATDKDQNLSRYRTVIEKDFPDYESIFVLISEDGRMYSDMESWDTLTFKDMEILLDEMLNSVSMKPDAAFFICNYKDSIGRDIVNHYALVECCNQIYQKHKKALDLIFENRMDDQNLVGAIIKETLKELADAGRIIFDVNQTSNHSLMFYTKDMDEYLLPLDEAKSSYRTHRVYCYNIIVRDKSMYATFEIGGFNATDAHRETMKNIISLHRPNEVMEDGFKFKRIIKTKAFDFGNVEEIEDAVRGVVEGFVDELLIMEAQLLFNLDNLTQMVSLDDVDFDMDLDAFE